ncbi:MFS transporter [Alkalibacter mobilis]|uniref:MFS transporter n=1 Tax=Alkalibacter mobilis TaxID=2787712 RepID=UPI00189EC791|nr:MFS transporter [Alkalibacter mobilis]MBF7097778.1 MFS transporter [Alkalibacter mobilis]
MKKNHITTVLAVLSIYFLLQGKTAVNPSLQNIAQSFSEIPFTTVLLISTLPSIFVIPATIITGQIAGSKVKFKTLLIVAISLFIVAGVAPYFLKNFTAILVSRCVFGVGLGMVSPLASTMVVRLFTGKQRANLLGIGAVIMSAGGVLFQMVAGILTTYNVRFTWLTYLLAVLTLILVLFFLPEPENITENLEETNQKSSGRLPKSVFLICIAFAFTMLFVYPLFLNTSTIIISENLGNAASAGTVLSLYTIGGMVAGLIFGQVSKILGKHVIPTAAVFAAMGSGIVFFGNSLLLLLVGSFFIGFGHTLILPAIYIEFGLLASGNGFAKAAGWLTGLANISAFVSGYYLKLIAEISGNASPRFPMIISIFGFLIIATIWWFVKLSNKSVKHNSEAA